MFQNNSLLYGHKIENKIKNSFKPADNELTSLRYLLRNKRCTEGNRTIHDEHAIRPSVFLHCSFPGNTALLLRVTNPLQFLFLFWGTYPGVGVVSGILRRRASRAVFKEA